MRRVPVWIPVLVLAIVAMVAARLPAATARQETAPPAGHPLVGSWKVTVSFDGQPPLVLPNLATYTSDGTAVIAAPPQLPETPGSTTPRDFFSPGHGTWVATGERTADLQFIFLVTDRGGNLASTNTVRATLELDATGDAYTGTFVLEIVDPAGRGPAPLTGTLRGSRIRVEPLAPVGTPAVGTPTAGTG